MRGWLVAVVVVVLIVGGFFLIKPPTPAIILAPEHVFDIGTLEVTNTMFTSWVVVALLIVTAVYASRSMTLVPSGLSGAIEAFVGGDYVGLMPMNCAIGVTEPDHGEIQAVFEQTTIAGVDLAYIPIQADTVDTSEAAALQPEHEGDAFSGLLAPLFRSVMTDVNAPLALALMSFIFVEYWGLSALGLGYLKKFFAFGNLLRGKPMGIIDVFVGLLELISELIRVVSFTFRLFGNIFAGEVLLLMMSFLVPLVLINVFYGLELFVGLIQAFVFAMLTLVFAQTAVSHHGDEHEEHGGAHE